MTRLTNTHPVPLLLATVAIAVMSCSCAVNRVIYSESTEEEGLLARVVVLEAVDMMELVVTMQESGGPIRESVFRVNWMPDHYEICDYNDDSRPDFRIVSTGGEAHYFYSTSRGFVEI